MAEVKPEPVAPVEPPAQVIPMPLKPVEDYRQAVVERRQGDGRQMSLFRAALMWPAPQKLVQS